MDRTLTLGGYGKRFLSFLSGLGMIAASVMTIRHFFLANYPASIYTGAFCDISAFFNCDSSAFSPISQVLGVPIGYFGLFVGVLVVLGAVFPSAAFERTNKFLALANVLGVVGLFLYSVFVLGSLCLLCCGYYVFSILSFILFCELRHRERRARRPCPLGPAVLPAARRLRRRRPGRGLRLHPLPRREEGGPGRARPRTSSGSSTSCPRSPRRASSRPTGR